MSVKTAGGSLTSRPGELARAGVNDIFAGLVASVITIAYGLDLRAAAQHLARLRHRRDFHHQRRDRRDRSSAKLAALRHRRA